MFNKFCDQLNRISSSRDINIDHMSIDEVSTLHTSPSLSPVAGEVTIDEEKAHILNSGFNAQNPRKKLGVDHSRPYTPVSAESRNDKVVTRE